MNNYIDGFVFPIPSTELETYKAVAEKVADVWKDHGALAYTEFVGDDLAMEGTISFKDAMQLKSNEVVVFGWVTFPSKEVRDLANEKVANDPRMELLVAPISSIFDARRMVYGGFKPLILK